MNSEKICRNLYRKICDVLFEIPSQIVQITAHFAMRYRGNRSLSLSLLVRMTSLIVAISGQQSPHWSQDGDEGCGPGIGQRRQDHHSL